MCDSVAVPLVVLVPVLYSYASIVNTADVPKLLLNDTSNPEDVSLFAVIGGQSITPVITAFALPVQLLTPSLKHQFIKTCKLP